MHKIKILVSSLKVLSKKIPALYNYIGNAILSQLFRGKLLLLLLFGVGASCR